MRTTADAEAEAEVQDNAAKAPEPAPPAEEEQAMQQHIDQRPAGAVMRRSAHERLHDDKGAAERVRVHDLDERGQPIKVLGWGDRLFTSFALAGLIGLVGLLWYASALFSIDAARSLVGARRVDTPLIVAGWDLGVSWGWAGVLIWSAVQWRFWPFGLRWIWNGKGLQWPIVMRRNVPGWAIGVWIILMGISIAASQAGLISWARGRTIALGPGLTFPETISGSMIAITLIISALLDIVPERVGRPALRDLLAIWGLKIKWL